ncbi:MAG: Slp family lipoprotein [Pseudomonadota bacterium]
MNAFVRRCVTALSLLALPALASAITTPDAVRHAPAIEVSVDQALAAPNAVDTVRWGGVIRSVEWQGPDATVLVSQRDLKRRGKPTSTRLDRHFLVALNDVEKPQRLQPGRRLTVTGPVTGVTTVEVHEHTLDVPVVGDGAFRTWRSEYVTRPVSRRGSVGANRLAYGGFYSPRFSRFGAFGLSPYRYGNFRRFGRSRVYFY